MRKTYNIFRLVIVAIMLGNGSALARDLGQHGRVYPIEEQSILEQMLSTAQDEVDSGKWAKRVEEWKKQAIAKTNRPKGINLPDATETISHLYDPTIVVPEDLKDANGLIIHKAGTRINPFSIITLSRKLVFIDGDRQHHIDWMVEQTDSDPEHFKVILTNGPVIDLMNQLQRRLYFDQHQQLITKLNISSLPALVYQQGQYLRIDEIAVQ